MAQLLSVRLGRVDAQPWGLRLQGGADFGTPLVIQKVSKNSTRTYNVHTIRTFCTGTAAEQFQILIFFADITKLL